MATSRGKRSHGSGSKRQRSPGVWELRYDGRSRTFRGTSTEAERELSRMVAQIGTSLATRPKATLGELLDEFFVTHPLEVDTRTTYQSAVKHLPDAARAWRLRQLAVRHFDSLYAQLERGGTSPNQIRKLHTVLSSALTDARRWGWIDHHPAQGARLPHVDPPAKPDIDHAWVRRLLDWSLRAPHERQEDLQRAVWIRLMITTGVRRGELMALRWSEVVLHPKRPSLWVRRSLRRDRSVKSTKTRRHRHLPIDDATAAMLRRWHAAQAERALACGVPLAEDPYVLSNSPDSSQPWVPLTASRRFRRLAERAGIPDWVDTRMLRHAYATILIDEGANPAVVARLMGHARTSTSMDIYTHVVTDADRDAVRAAGRRIDGAVAEQRRVVLRRRAVSARNPQAHRTTRV